MNVYNENGEIMFDHDNLKFFLKNNIATVVFTKANGDERKLKCTLKEEFIPKSEAKITHKSRKSGGLHLSVWDLENSGWRSFSLESIKYIELT